MFEDFTLTSYAPAMRYTNGQLENQSKLILENKQLVSFVESISQMVLILNRHRQVIYANNNYKNFARQINHDPILGKRPGETFNCTNAFKSAAGCGTSDACKSCGAVNAILESQKGKRSTKECQVLTTSNDALDLKVTATPLTIDNIHFTIFSIIDISAENRRKSLERVFIHDILNTAGAISGLSSIMAEVDDINEIRDLAKTIVDASRSLIDEIQAQRELGAAERGELQPQIAEFDTTPVLTELQRAYAKHEHNLRKPIVINNDSVNCTIATDRVQLKRIVGNMIKNAVEINVPDDLITLSCNETENSIQISVHNKSYIPENVQNQIFKRFFSTKGKGRGLGTYSMKLLGEKYLKGKVDFISSKTKGTTFYIQLPKVSQQP